MTGIHQRLGYVRGPRPAVGAHDIVPRDLRNLFRWDERHDHEAANIVFEFHLAFPDHRELIRQLAFLRVAQGKGGAA